jgi:hypothetical protein
MKSAYVAKRLAELRSRPAPKPKKAPRLKIVRTPEQMRVYERQKRGLPTPTRPEPRCCECCDREPKSGGLHLDHDHDTGEFRGWLCRSCNTGLGLLGDNMKALDRAAYYLSGFKNVTPSSSVPNENTKLAQSLGIAEFYRGFFTMSR